MATGGKDRQSREQRDRAKAYRARQELHRRQSLRRRRDTVLAVVVGGIVILGAVGVQTAYFVAGPGAPTPAPEVTDAPTPAPTPADSIAPAPLPTPTPTPTP